MAMCREQWRHDRVLFREYPVLDGKHISRHWRHALPCFTVGQARLEYFIYYIAKYRLHNIRGFRLWGFAFWVNIYDRCYYCRMYCFGIIFISWQFEGLQQKH